MRTWVKILGGKDNRYRTRGCLDVPPRHLINMMIMTKIDVRQQILLFVFSALFGLWSASATGSEDYFLQPEPPPVYQEGQQLKIMAYNIHHANPPSRPEHIDVDAIVEAIRKQAPDLVALQEVDVNTARSGNIDQAKLIAEKLGMHYFFAKAIDYDGGAYGQAVLSKYPISEEQIHRLPSKEGSGGEPRILATVRVDLPGGRPIRFGTVHLDAQRDPKNRMMQAEKLTAIARDEPLPFVMAGDFNTTEDDPVFDVLRNEWVPTCKNCPFTIPVVQPKKAIDFILFDRKHPWEVVSHVAVDEQYASDHLPIVSILKL